jgi:cold shock CspA family protein
VKGVMGAAGQLVGQSAMRGRIKSFVRGQGTGYIRDQSGRDVFFHKGDVMDKGYNDLEVGAEVSFEVIDDAISGARAQKIKALRRASRNP